MAFSFIKSKFFAVLGLAALLMLSVFLGRQLLENYQVRKEIAGLENEISKYESKNQEILGLINYLKTPEYRERQARSLLNLQKPGEFAVALPARNSEDQSTGQAGKPEPVSNLRKWWEYFFGE